MSPPVFAASDVRAALDTYCVSCHNQTRGTANLGLDTLDVTNLAAHPATWEKVVTKLRTGTMPPVGRRRPDAATYAAVAEHLEAGLDRSWEANPHPGRIDAVHRLTRDEYNNAIRDLLALDVDVRSELPSEATADGAFDNLAELMTISTIHLNRYMSVARKVSRMAVGLPPTNVTEVTQVETSLIQEDLMSPDLPLGSRGGVAIPYVFAVDGEYGIKVVLQRNYQDYLRGMGWPQPLDIRLDGKLLERFTIGGGGEAYRPAPWAGDAEPGFDGAPEWEEYMLTLGDAGVEVRAQVEAGQRVVSVSFPRAIAEAEDLPQAPLWAAAFTGQDADERYKGYAMVHEVQVSGPYRVAGLPEDTPSRRAIFVCQPKAQAEEEACAGQIVSNLARRAFRRSVTNEEVESLLAFYRLGREGGGSFDAGIQMALERILVDPDFLLRIYRDPPTVQRTSAAQQAPAAYPLSNLELASRLSFFLWSSLPDDALLTVAEDGRLTDPRVLREQASRLFADTRAVDALVDGFVSQWLNLRLLDEFTFAPSVYPDADGDLVAALDDEPKLFVGSTLREDRSVLELLSADYTYVNERLARHYGIPDVYGSHFRRVTIPNLQQRGGILGQAGILALSSYPNRTSPVLRGKWLLDNILGTPPAPPPSNVDTTLEEDAVSESAPIRERFEKHRTDPLCATCHSVIDPLGFALESYDVLGGHRTADERGNPVDNRGTWPSGVEIDGFTGLRSLLLDQREQFVRTVTAKLMAYALGRSLEYYDQPTVRRIAREAAADGYRWSSIVLGVIESPAFRMRASSATGE